MVLSDLQKRQRAKDKRTSSRKHPGVRTPAARNAIVKDRDTGNYVANAESGELADFANEVLLRLNALELNVSSLQGRQSSVERGHAAPLASNNVVPMDVARKAKEQSKAAPVSQPGNEAEVQVLPVPSAEPPLKVANVEPKHIKVEPTPSEAANDEAYDVVPEKLSRIMMPEDLGFVAELAEGYEMSLVEASEILSREYERRLNECERKHGKPRTDVRLERALRNYKRDYYIHAENCVTGFSDWWHETQARLPYLKSQRDARLASEPKRKRAPYVKGEAKYRRRTMLRHLAEQKRANPEGYRKVQLISDKLHVGPGPTSGAQIKAVATVGWDLYQRTRKFLGMKPTIRSNTLRTRYEVANTLSNNAGPGDGSTELVYGPLTAAEHKESQAELVRRYQRTGIGY